MVLEQRRLLPVDPPGHTEVLDPDRDAAVGGLADQLRGDRPVTALAEPEGRRAPEQPHGHDRVRYLEAEAAAAGDLDVRRALVPVDPAVAIVAVPAPQALLLDQLDGPRLVRGSTWRTRRARPSGSATWWPSSVSGTRSLQSCAPAGVAPAPPPRTRVAPTTTGLHAERRSQRISRNPHSPRIPPESHDGTGWPLAGAIAERAVSRARARAALRSTPAGRFAPAGSPRAPGGPSRCA